MYPLRNGMNNVAHIPPIFHVPTVAVYIIFVPIPDNSYAENILDLNSIF